MGWCAQGGVEARGDAAGSPHSLCVHKSTKSPDTKMSRATRVALEYPDAHRRLVLMLQT